MKKKLMISAGIGAALLVMGALALVFIGQDTITSEEYVELPLWQLQGQAMEILAEALVLRDDKAIEAHFKEAAALGRELKEAAQKVTAGRSLSSEEGLKELHQAQLVFCDALVGVEGAWTIDEPEVGAAALVKLDTAYAEVEQLLTRVSSEK